MELALDIARLVLSSRGAAQCSEQMLSQVQGIIENGSPLSVHTFIVHRQCQQKSAQCTSALLLEVWTVSVKSEKNCQEKILDALFLKNAVRSHLHFSQLWSWMASNGGQLPNDTAFEYRFLI
ncbi:unnamed protein product [Gongylonema pulchrum]|uniref:Uncharacterized protein n=1 Tax=Gongylonema pulchrum TaxID=637853 RepID=A0A183EHM6_9BILA|nr:unnamed protein product [Gongylonema pulchrum]VDN45398.1 unnamed protein product [Gongylonema pulchrum]